MASFHINSGCRLTTLGSVFILSLYTPIATAETDSAWRVSLGVGVGLRTNPVMDNADIPLVVIPHLSYQGEHLFIDNLDLGWSLAEAETYQLSILATPSYDQVFFNRWDARNFVVESSYWASLKNDISPSNGNNNIQYQEIDKARLHPRRMAELLGIEWRQSLSQHTDLSAQCLQEITGYFDGQECRLALSNLLRFGAHELVLSAGLNWQNAATLDYYYGWRNTENADPQHTAPAYTATAGVSRLIRVDWTYPLNSRWDMRLLASYKQLPSAISLSPLVTQDHVVTVFVGGVYHF